ncbi:MAG: amidohydrolase family protein [Methanospirillum sp.]|uniref:amidohydrolase family protein n=1 Tax=Methanospirillum sp. TaxID=45200 RepID=UPI00236B3E98|nr:amidohydrolase family protein [Methanospirillum sp.]MDD1728385.1 amidohydrolase family protein [Methanospirillum sp.]
MTDETTYSGVAFLGDPLEPRPVTIVVEAGIITRIEDEKRVPDRWICPAFFNAHTHLADTVAMDIPCSGDLESLVSPPHGLKHQILAKTPPEDLVEAMRSSVLSMIKTGTAGFIDFREGGAVGVSYLQEACKDLSSHPVILGREGGEEISDGAGISSARDISSYEEIVSRMKKTGKLIAFHAGERDSADIDAALACEPDILVHGTHAGPHQIRAIADAGIPVVICPRSNFLLGATTSSDHPPVREMREQGVEILIGTDNAMFVQPDMMQEISFAHTVYRIPAEELLSSATRGFSAAGIDHTIREGNWANFNVIDYSDSNLRFSHDPVTSVVKRSPTAQICASIFYVESKLINHPFGGGPHV